MLFPIQKCQGSGKPFGFPLDHNPVRRLVPTDYPLLPLCGKRFVLADKDCVFDSNFPFVGCLKRKMRTDKPSSLHSFIKVKGRKKIGASISPILFAKTELSYNAHYKTLPLPHPFARPAPTPFCGLPQNAMGLG